MSLSELLSTYGGNYASALLSTWGMTAVCFAIVMVVAVIYFLFNYAINRFSVWLSERTGARVIDRMSTAAE